MDHINSGLSLLCEIDVTVVFIFFVLSSFIGSCFYFFLDALFLFSDKLLKKLFNKKEK